jgi:insulysin
MFRLYAALVSDSLTEYSYDASLAGLYYSFSNHKSGLAITLKGYNDKLLVLARTVLARAKTLYVNPERLAVMKERVYFFSASINLKVECHSPD